MARLLLFLIGLAIGSFSPNFAAANFTVCNGANVTQSVSIAHRKDGEWVSEGWWSVKPFDCEVILTGALKGRYYYYRATAVGRVSQTKGHSFCTSPSAYTIVGKSNCQARGYEVSAFKEVDTGPKAKTFVLNLEEPKLASVPKQGGAPGTYGEPFTVSGVFQGCGMLESGYSCSFHAEGVKWYVLNDGKTPVSVLGDMETLRVGDLIQVQGDMLFLGDISVEAMVRSVKPIAPQTEAQNIQNGLQGRWRVVGDPLSEMWVIGGESYDYYDRELMDVSYLSFTNSCEGSNGAGPVMIKRTPETQESFCYVIAGWDAESLQVYYVGGAGGGDIAYQKIR